MSTTTVGSILSRTRVDVSATFWYQNVFVCNGIDGLGITEGVESWTTAAEVRTPSQSLSVYASQSSSPRVLESSKTTHQLAPLCIDSTRGCLWAISKITDALTQIFAVFAPAPCAQAEPLGSPLSLLPLGTTHRDVAVAKVSPSPSSSTVSNQHLLPSMLVTLVLSISIHGVLTGFL